MEMDQEQNIYVTPKANSTKNGKCFSTRQEPVANKLHEKKTPQGPLLSKLSKSGEKTIQQRSNERSSMQLATKKPL